MPWLRRVLAAFVVIAGVGLAGCTSTVSLSPSSRAGDPSCAGVMVRLPGSVAGESRRWTDAQSTAAWGDPASILLTCGLDQLAPTTLPCLPRDGVDWVIDDTDAPRYRVTSFNRSPAVEIYLDNSDVSSTTVLDVLSPLVAQLPDSGAACTSVSDTTG